MISDRERNAASSAEQIGESYIVDNNGTSKKCYARANLRYANKKVRYFSTYVIYPSSVVLCIAQHIIIYCTSIVTNANYSRLIHVTLVENVLLKLNNVSRKNEYE